MLQKLLNKLEDPKRPLLGPNVKALKFWGVLLPEKPLSRGFYIFLHITVIVFTATECVDVWFIRHNINLLLTNLKITLLATVSVIKIVTFLIWQKHWTNIIDYVSTTDLTQRQDKKPEKTTIINSYTNHLRKITYFHWSLMYTTVVIVISQPVFKYFLSETYRNNVKNGTESYIEVVNSWVPFDKKNIAGYLFASAYQSYAAIYGGGWITSFDTNAVGVMIFLKGELELIKFDSADIFNSKSDDKEIRSKIVGCHKRHVNLLKYSRLLDSCLSPVMLYYVFVCSVMLCVTAYQMNTETNFVQRLLNAEYLIFGVSQLFLYCWHSNEVLYMSRELMYGPYKSLWWQQKASYRKEVFMLVEQFKKTIVFNAGPFAKLTVPTFISILKGAYSYYTLLSQSQENK